MQCVWAPTLHSDFFYTKTIPKIAYILESYKKKQQQHDQSVFDYLSHGAQLLNPILCCAAKTGKDLLNR